LRKHQPSGQRFTFLLDADLSPEVALVARSLGLDVVSVYECGRADLTDDEQLRLAAQDRRIFVTQNRNDFLHWTKEFLRTGRAHTGLIIVSRSIIATRPEPLAYALREWAGRMQGMLSRTELEPYFVDFLSTASVRD
jgi:predicted nuclease of predicted toxin-antitoxin system